MYNATVAKKLPYIYARPTGIDLKETYDLVLNDYVSKDSALLEYSVFASFEGPGPYCPAYPGSGGEQC